MQCPYCFKQIRWISYSLDRPTLTEGECIECNGDVTLSFSLFGMVIMLIVSAVILTLAWGKMSTPLLLGGLGFAVAYGSVGLEKQVH